MIEMQTLDLSKWFHWHETPLPADRCLTSSRLLTLQKFFSPVSDFLVVFLVHIRLRPDYSNSATMTAKAQLGVHVREMALPPNRTGTHDEREREGANKKKTIFSNLNSLYRRQEVSTFFMIREWHINIQIFNMTGNVEKVSNFLLKFWPHSCDASAQVFGPNIGFSCFVNLIS